MRETARPVARLLLPSRYWRHHWLVRWWFHLIGTTIDLYAQFAFGDQEVAVEALTKNDPLEAL